MSYMTISSQEKHNFSLCSCFHAHPTTLLLKILGGPMHGRSSHLKFWEGPSPQSPLGLRPCFFPIAIQGHQSWGLRVTTPRFWGVAGRVAGRGAGGSLESWTGREILLYLIMYRKYVRKWLLLKRNKIICPEVAVNGQIFNCLKISKFSEICL